MLPVPRQVVNSVSRTRPETVAGVWKVSGNQQQARRGSSRTHAVLQEHGQQRSGDVFGLVFCRPFQVAGWGEGKVWAMGRIAGRSAPKSSLHQILPSRGRTVAGDGKQRWNCPVCWWSCGGRKATVTCPLSGWRLLAAEMVGRGAARQKRSIAPVSLFSFPSLFPILSPTFAQRSATL